MGLYGCSIILMWIFGIGMYMDKGVINGVTVDSLNAG